MRTTIEFFLNGERVSLPGSAGARTVLSWLREERRLTGTKEGCAEGDCGACTAVLAQQRPSGETIHLPINTCIFFLGALDGKALTTVEGLKGTHPVQRAMVDCHGSQCGFCTPGFVMALYAHYKGRNEGLEQSLSDALAGNLCRCTGYAPILAAGERMFCLEAAAEELAPLSDLPQTSLRTEAFSAPRSVAELADMLEEDATLLGGGTDLGLAVTKQHRDLEKLVYLGRVAELRAIADHPDRVEIGGAVTYDEAHGALAGLHADIGELVRRLGAAQVRACGTLAGNIANGSPIGDSMPVLLALGASLLLQQGTTMREVSLAHFYTGYRNSVLKPREFIRSIRVPKLQRGARFAAYKLSKRFDQDISSVCAAFHVDAQGKPAFGFGGMAATPARALRAEAVYGKGIEAACVALAADFNPLSDQRASAWYRIRAAQALLRKFHGGIGPRRLLEITA